MNTYLYPPNFSELRASGKSKKNNDKMMNELEKVKRESEEVMLILDIK